MIYTRRVFVVGILNDISPGPTKGNLGPVSISEKTSFRKISYSLEATRVALKFDRHIGSTAVEVPVKFQSDRTILNTNLAASRLYEILRKDVFSNIETGPRGHFF